MQQLIAPYPQVQIVTTTKKLVDALLAINTHNRTPKRTNINRLRDDMVSNHFLLTASGIGVSKTGVLLDGQNRLMAVRDAGYPAVKLVMVTGLDDESQMDNAMVSLVNALHTFSATIGKEFDFVLRSGGAVLTDYEMSDYVAENFDLLHAVVSEAKTIRAPTVAALYVYCHHDMDKGMEFIRAVRTGVGLTDDSPAYRLRAALERLKNNNSTPGRLEQFKASVSAVIADASDKKVKLLKGSDSWANSTWRWTIKPVKEPAKLSTENARYRFARQLDSYSTSPVGA